MDQLTKDVYRERLMNTLSIPLHHQQLTDMIDSVPEGASIAAMTPLRHGQVINAFKDGVTYAYRGERVWEAIGSFSRPEQEPNHVF